MTQNWNPGGGLDGVWNDQPVGVSFSRSERKWTIQNASKTSKMPDASFNVMVVGSDVHGAFVHRSTADNTDTNWTSIDHPLTNGNPNALIYVTQNRVENVQTCQGLKPIGVEYKPGEGKWGIYYQDGAGIPEECVFHIVVPTNESDYFIHQVPPGTGGFSILDHPLTNTKPYSFLFITHNRSPGGVMGPVNNHPIGVWYRDADEKWTILNSDETNMSDGPTFNVLLPNVDARVFLHHATEDNTSDNYTLVDYPLTNNIPDALLFITHNFAPGGSVSTINNTPNAVLYQSDTTWSIINLDSEGIIVYSYFNIMVLSHSHNVFIHESNALNNSGDRTFINHPLTNNNPNAYVYITRNINPGNGGWGPTHNHVTGVVFDSTENKWAIYNQDGVDMPIHVAFNVLVMANRISLPVVMR